MGASRTTIPALLLTAASLLSGCNRPNFNPKLATEPYPFELHTTDTLPIQVFRDGSSLEIVNSTERSWGEVTIWVNQQYAHDLPSLGVGEHVTLHLTNFRNDYGEQFNAGGFFRTRQPTPVRLVELQPGEGQPLVGLIAIRSGEGE